MAIQYAGGTNVNATFTGTDKNAILTGMYSNLPTAGWSVQSGITPSTVTMTIASPCVVTLTSHGLADGTRIVFSTTGALPTGITANTVYFVKSPSTNTFNVASSSGGSAINTSGSQSGTHTMNSEILFKTATTPQGYNICCRARDNAANCIQLSIESSDGAKVGTNDGNHGASMLPGVGKTYRIVANKYQFGLWVSADYATAREFAFVSCPYIFSFFSSISYLGLLVSNTVADNSTQHPTNNWRYSAVDQGRNTLPNFQVLYNTSIWENTNTVFNAATYVSMPLLVSLMGPQFDNAIITGTSRMYRYANNDDITSDALVSWGLTNFGDEPQIRCQLWDALLIYDNFTGDTTTSFDSHNWIAVTSSNSSSTKVALFLVTP